MSFGGSSSDPNTWHYASIKVIQDFPSIIGISTQGESSQTVVSSSVGPLRDIYYGSDEGIINLSAYSRLTNNKAIVFITSPTLHLELTPEMQSIYHSGAVVPPFMGCLRNLKLSVDGASKVSVEFPESTQHLVHGVCPL